MPRYQGDEALFKILNFTILHDQASKAVITKA